MVKKSMVIGNVMPLGMLNVQHVQGEEAKRWAPGTKDEKPEKLIKSRKEILQPEVLAQTCISCYGRSHQYEFSFYIFS
jgi:hypothetical protein